MKHVRIAWIILGSFLYSQYNSIDYPDWFLTPSLGEGIVGLSKKLSYESVTFMNAYLDALAINELLQDGTISANIIASHKKLADSLGISLDSEIEFPDGIQLIKIFSIADLFCGLFSFTYEEQPVGRAKVELNRKKIMAIGKQTLHPDRIFESWASAEIEAFKELSRIKKSKIKSIFKKNSSKFEKLIYLQSDSNFYSARIERRWIDHNIAYVKVSDLY